MIFSDEFIFLHLQKTGGTHVVKLLSQYFPLEKMGKHNGIVGSIERPYVLVGIRNPWDWYVSLWAYGCQRKGNLWEYLVSPRARNVGMALGKYGSKTSRWPELAIHMTSLYAKAPGFWRDLYRDVEDPELFRSWIRAIHHAPTNRQTGEGYSAFPIYRECGLMTARYLQISSREADWDAHRRSIRTASDALAFRNSYSAATHFIRTEHLENDLYEVLIEMGVSIDSIASLSSAKTNSSKHRDTAYYYNEETARLIGQRDRIIIEAHGFEQPATFFS